MLDWDKTDHAALLC